MSAPPASAPAASASSACLVLDRCVRVSHSRLWDWQSSFYSDSGLDAWRTGTVPHFVTANAFIAQQYARLLLAFLSDVCRSPKYARRLRRHEPIYMLELGAGAGKFSFLVLQALWELRAFWPTSEEQETGDTAAASAAASSSVSPSATPLRCPFVYIMSDFTPEIVAFWRAHPLLLPFLQRGMLDFAVIDAEQPGAGSDDGSIRLLHSGRRLSAATNHNPICLIANYLFDTLRQDAFRVVPVTAPVPASAATAATGAAPSSAAAAPLSLQLQESLITVTSPNAYEPDLSDPALIRRFRHAWTHRDVPGAIVPLQAATDAASSAAAVAPAAAAAAASSLEYYSGEDADLNPLLRDLLGDLAADYASTVAAGLAPPSGYSVLVPVGGLRCLRYFHRVSHGNLLCLMGDKSYSSLLELQGLREPHLAIHGAFSTMVNFDCIRRWIERAETQDQLQHAQGGASTEQKPRSKRGGASLNTPYLDGFKVSAFACMDWDDSAETVRMRAECTAAAAAAAAAASSSALAAASSVSPTASPSSALLVCLLRETSLAFHSLCSFGPDHFSALQRCVKDECAAPSLKHVLSLLRLSGHDADVFWKFRHAIIEAVAGGSASTGVAGLQQQTPPSDKVLRDLRCDLHRIARSYFPLTLPLSSDAAAASAGSGSCPSSSSHKDVSFELGRLAMSLRDYAAALGFFDASRAWVGEDAITHYNRGLSLVALARLPEAAQAFERAAQLRAAEGATYEEATQWAERTKTRMQAEAEAAQRQQQQQQLQLQTQQQQQPPPPPSVDSQPPQSNGFHSRHSSGFLTAHASAPSAAVPPPPPATHISRDSFGGQPASADANKQQLARSYHNLPFPSIAGTKPAAAAATSAELAAPAMAASEPVHPALAHLAAPPAPSNKFYEHHNSSSWL